ncbi:MAG: tetratricopeptide repeat protein [Balneolaceae bacterium]
MKENKPINEELERKIDLYIHGKLDVKEIDELWTELIQDDEYLDYLESVANLKQIIEEREQVQSRLYLFKSKSRKWMVAAAAAVILLVGSLAIYNVSFQEDSIQPISSIELDYYRSMETTDQEDQRSEEAIREAIILANNGEYQMAIDRIDEELEITDDLRLQASLHINAGSIMYNIGNYSQALERFETVVDLQESDEIVRERAYWYLGNTYFQLNNVERAREAFQKAYELNGAYSRIAQSYLRALASSR